MITDFFEALWATITDWVRDAKAWAVALVTSATVTATVYWDAISSFVVALW